MAKFLLGIATLKGSSILTTLYIDHSVFEITKLNQQFVVTFSYFTFFPESSSQKLDIFARLDNTDEPGSPQFDDKWLTWLGSMTDFRTQPYPNNNMVYRRDGIGK